MPAPDQSTITPESSTVDFSRAGKGDTFGNYELIDEIARGGMGVVYKARHRKLNRTVALKMILGGRFSSADDIQRFQMEAEAAARLDHSGIVSIYDVGEHEGQAYFAMKYVEGGSLGDRMAELRADPESAARLMAAVARSVHHGHQRGILHRDLKPANILIDDDGDPLVTDYGLAKSTGDESNITKTGAVVGTPSYMSPEQAGGQSNLSTATDVYAIGAILYELITGRPPHKEATPMKTVMSVINETPEPPSSINRNVDRDLELICLKCIERDPDNRYSNAAAIADDLDAWLEGGRISVQPPSLLAVARRWLKENKNVAYSAAAMSFGAILCLPFLVGFFNNDNVSSLYEYFPEDERPWFEPFTKLPHWADDVSIALLVLIFWPAIGLWNAFVTKPKTVRRAVAMGALTSSILLVMAFLALSWIVVLVSASQHSSPTIQTLADAVWASDAEQDTAREAVDSLYSGIDEVPEDVRARVLSNRVFNDQIETAVMALTIFVGVGIAFCIPIIAGTVIGMILLGRHLGFFGLRVRYVLAWLGTTAILAIVGAYAIGTLTGNVNFRLVGYHIAIVAVSVLTVWLTLTRPRVTTERSEPSEPNATVVMPAETPTLR